MLYNSCGKLIDKKGRYLPSVKFKDINCGSCGKLFSTNRGRLYCSRPCFLKYLHTIYSGNSQALINRNRKISASHIADKNPQWLGDKVSYRGLHDWLRKNFSPPKECLECKRELKLDLANVTGKYVRDISHYRWLCRGCHVSLDRWGRDLKCLWL